MAGFPEQHARNTSEGASKRKKEPLLPDISLLNNGAREPFTVATVARVGVTSVGYDGVLQGLKDFFGFGLQPAPALVLLVPDNRDRLQQLTQAGFSYPMPPEGSHDIGYTYEDANPMFIANPESATREQIAQAGTRAYAYAINPQLLTESDTLWAPAKSVNYQRKLPFTPSEITSVVSGEAVTKGLATVVAAMTMLPSEDAATKLAGIVSGTEDGESTRDERESYLQGKLATLRRARDILVTAETAVMDTEAQDRLPGLYTDAHRLKEDAIETIGVFYVAGFLQIYAQLAKGIRSDVRRSIRRQKWIEQMLKNPPEKLGELLDPRKFFANQFHSNPDLLADFDETTTSEHQSRHGIYPPPEDHDPARETVSGGRKTKRKNTSTLELPPYPLTNTDFAYYISEPQTVIDSQPGSTHRLTVPFYYHGMPATTRVSALITPDVVNQYAHLGTDSYPAGTEERIIEALFDPIRQMDADPNQQNQHANPSGLAHWNQAEFHVIRHCPPLGPDRVYADTGITLPEVASNLLTAGGGEFAKTETGRLKKKALFKKHPGEKLHHETLLKHWLYGTQARERLTREDQALRAKTDPSKLSFGITLESMQNALTSDALTAEGSILPNEQDRIFLQNMVDFIARGTLADQEMQNRRSPRTLYDASETHAKPHEKTAAAVTQQNPEGIKAFEKNFIVLRAPIEEAEIPGFGRVLLINEQTSFDPLITPDLLKAYSADTTGDPQHMQHVLDTLFGPFEQTRDMVASAQNEYPESFTSWIHPANALGFALFPYGNSTGEICTGYGYIASKLHEALEHRFHRQLTKLAGITDETHDYLSRVLTTLQETVMETLSDGTRTIFIDEQQQ